MGGTGEGVGLSMGSMMTGVAPAYWLVMVGATVITISSGTYTSSMPSSARGS